MPIPTSVLRLGDRNNGVGDLQRTLTILGLQIPEGERRARVLGRETEAALRQFQEKYKLPPTGIYDQSTQDRLRDVLTEQLPFGVHGTVTGVDGQPLAGIQVFAVDMDFRQKNEPLGDTVTDDHGQFEIRYTADKFARQEQGTADLVVRARQGEHLIAESSILFNAPAEAQVDLRSSTGRGLSELEALLAKIRPVIGDVVFADLDAADVAFLAGDTEQPAERIQFVATAHRSAAKLVDLPADAFYAWLREGQPGELAGLLANTSDILQAALERACKQNIIGAAREKDIPAWMAALGLRRARIVDAPAPAGASASAGDITRGAGLTFASDEARLRVVEVIDRMGQAPVDQQVKALDDAGLSRADSERLVSHQQDVRAVGGQAPVLRVLEQRGVKTAEARAAMSIADWRDALATRIDDAPIAIPSMIAAETPEARLDAYASYLSDRASAAAPMVAVRQAIGELPDGFFTARGATRADVIRFLDNNPDFVLGTDSVAKLDELTAEDRDRRLAGIAASGPTLATVEALSQVAMLVGLNTEPFDPDVTPPRIRPLANAGGGKLGHRRTVDAWKALLAGGITKALDIATTSMPDTSLVETLATVLAPNLAVSLAESSKANATQTATMVAWQRLEQASLTLAAPAAMKIGPRGGKKAKGVDWAALFGSEDACLCTECASVLSPSAYLVDLVDFIKDFPAPTGATTTGALWAIAMSRRGDIQHIPLTCDNSDTALPLIDVVNELLEDLVAPRSNIVIELAPPTTPPADPPLWNGTVPAGCSFAAFELPAAAFSSQDVTPAMRVAFRASPNAIVLGDDARVVTLGSRLWQVIDGGRLFDIVRRPALGLGARYAVTAQWRQTGKSSAELRALPEHWNLAAYAVLASQHHPMQLPFDLAHQEGSAYLDELDIKRSDLIGAMVPTELAGSVVDARIANELLGLAPEEARLLTDITITAAELWGYDAAVVTDWTTQLSHVPELLRRAGIEYLDLLALVAARFIDDNDTVDVVGPPDDLLTCQLDKLTVTGLDATKLGRMMRFIRLWRRIGWSVFDLDRALTAFAPGIDLQRLAIAKAFAERFALDIPETIAWWSDLDRTGYPDVAAIGQPRQLSFLAGLFDPTRSLRTATTDASADPRRHAVLAACGLATIDVQALIDAQVLIGNETLTPDDVSLVSLLFRYASLARALQTDVATVLRLTRVLGRPPFASPAATVLFIAANDRFRASTFSLDEVDYLLQPPSASPQDPALSTAAIQELLGSLYDELRATAADTETTDDPQGERLRALLVQLGWTDAAAATLRDEATAKALHTRPLAIAPNVVWSPIPGDLTYDSRAGTLAFAGVMRDARRDELLAGVDAAGAVAAQTGATVTTADIANARTAIKAAITGLYNGPANTIPDAAFGRIVLPVSEAPLDWLPAAVVLPPDLARQLRYDTTARMLVLLGDLTTADRDAMIAQRPTTLDAIQTARWDAFRDALDALSSATRNQWPPTTDNSWTPLATLRGLASDAVGSTVLLEAALKIQRMRRVRDAIVRAVARASGLPIPSVTRNASALAVLEAVPALAPSEDAVATIIRWHKVGLVARKLNLTGTQIELLWTRGDPLGFTKLTALPTRATETAAAFSDLSSWLSFVFLRDAVDVWQRPVERVLGDLSAASAATRLAVVAAGTGWGAADVTAFVPTASYTDLLRTPTILEQLARATRLSQIRRVALVDLIAFARSDLDAAATVRLRSLVQERLRPKDWLKVAEGIHDDLRQRRRDALVAYVVTHVAPVAAPPTISADKFDSANSVFEYLWIDTQVNPCVQTSRIRQATASLQMLVERALAGEESIDPTPAVPGWKWRWETWEKRYRVWEANRKLFIYPENWLDPALRDDRTNEFRALEADLARPDLTPDAALAAYQRYVSGVDQLFQLEVVAFLPEIDANNREISHLFARTRAAPRTFYYRRFQRDRQSWSSAQWLAQPGTWSTWEKIDLDIPGDHVIPLRIGTGEVVPAGMSGDLALVWPVFQKAAGEDRRTADERKNGTPVPQEWQLQFHVSRYRNGQWSKKQVATDPQGRASVYSIPYDAVRKTERQFHFAWRAYTTDDREPTTTDRPRILVYSRVPDTFTFAPIANDVTTGTIAQDQLLRVILHSNGIAVSGRKIKLTTGFRVLARDSFTIPYIAAHFSSSVPLPTTYVQLDTIGYTDADGRYELALGEGDLQAILDRNESTIRNALARDCDTPLFGPPGLQPSGIVPDQQAVDRYNRTSDALVANFADAGQFLGVIVHVEVDEADLVDTPGADAASVIGKLVVEQLLYTSSPSQLVLELDVITARWVLVGAGLLSTAGTWSPLSLPVDTFKEQITALTIDGPWFQNGATRVIRSARQLAPVGTIAGWSAPAQEYVVTSDDDRWDGELAMVGTSPTAGSMPLQPDRWQWKQLVGKGTSTPDVSLFASASPAAPYAWEVGFHAPYAIACALTRAGRFESAQEWLRRIFDPTPATQSAGQSDADRARACWLFPPFADRSPTGGDAELLRQINAWLEAPFRPHVVAALRPSAYMRATVMAYLDNLIAWGDRLFERGTPESVDEAVMVYVRADKILGERPGRIPPRGKPVPHNVTTLPRSPDLGGLQYWVSADQLASVQLPLGQNVASILMFCMTANDRLLDYWDTVADRLYKIRNCLDIHGRRRAQNLYEAPIDPGLLAAAAASGLDIDSALDDMSLDAPTHRFNVLAQRATELCNEVKSLGAQLLAALEKQDAEHVSIVRAAHETGINELVLSVKQATKREAEANREALETARVAAVQRLNDARVYVGQKGAIQPAVGSAVALVTVPALGLKVQSIEPPDTGAHDALESVNRALSPLENVFAGGDDDAAPLTGCLMLEDEARELRLLEEARASQEIAEDLEKMGAYLRIIPTLHVVSEPMGFGTNIEIGGRMFGEILTAMAQSPRSQSIQQTHQASRHARAGGFLLRHAEWAQRHNQAALEVMSIDKQILAARIREEIANNDLDVQQRQLEDSQAMEELIRNKFSSEALYTWMSQETLRLYDRAFNVALGSARKAQRAFRYELARDDLTFIGGEYWQDGRAGLLAGERLHHDLKRMEVAYVDENLRELELSKQLSLRTRFPDEFYDLIETGSCEFDIDEGLFDLDYPGQYLRRLRSVSITIPCVAGPNTNVCCTLSLLGHRTRRKPSTGTPYVETPEGDDARFSYGFGPVQAIATSTAQNDAGVFEVNFRDERYLPFEGTGAISTWSIELPPKQNAFDLRTVTDVILHVTYTARDAGGRLRLLASSAVANRGGTLALDVRREFPDAWAAAQAPGVDLSLALTPRHFPFLPDSKGRVLVVRDSIGLRGASPTISVTRGGNAVTSNVTLGAVVSDTPTITVGIPRAAMAGNDTLILTVDYRPPTN